MHKHLMALIAVLTLVVFVSSASVATAACSHKNTKTEYRSTSYEYINSSVHWKHMSFDKICTSCGYTEFNYLGMSTPEVHVFSGYKCRHCNFRIAFTEKPTQKELQSEARELGDRALGATAVVIYGGNLRQQPATDSLDLDNVHANETYEILAVEYTLGHVWYKVNNGVKTGWVSASLVQVLPAAAVTSGANPELVGRTVVINVDSGRMRNAPGTASEKVGNVYRGYCTPILDCGYDQSGTLWYKVNNGSMDGWISSGIADLK